MSCYEWERGTIRIPAGQWAGFRKNLLKLWNGKQDELLADAKRAHAKCKAAAKGKRGTKRQDALRDALLSYCGLRDRFESNERYAALRSLLLKREAWDGPVKLVAPKAKDLAKHAVSKSATCHMPDASVTFDNATKSVTWDVPENNHACERASEHWFARALFTALGRVKWTRGSGGEIVGNDEYNRDENRYEAGGGGSYVKATYKALTKAEKAAKARRERERYSYRYGW